VGEASESGEVTEHMRITIEISKEAESKLQKRADEMGKQLPEFIEYLVEREARFPNPSFDELAAPIRKQTKESGMTEEEIEEFVDELVREVRAEKPLHLR
jgi:hypothetical protein